MPTFRLYRCAKPLVFVFMFGATIAASDAQERTVVQLDPIANRSEESLLDSLADAVLNAITITLRLMDRYEVVVNDTVVTEQQSYEPSPLRTRAIRERFDNIIFGDISRTDAGEYRIALASYDRVLDEVNFVEEVTFASLLDTFAVVDDITLSMIEGFSGIRLTFGSIRLEPTPTGEPVTVSIGDVAVSDVSGSLDRVPAGEHRIIMRQDRPLGVWERETAVTVETDSVVTVPIAGPELTGAESAVIDRAVMTLQDRIIAGSLTATSHVLDDATAEAIALLETPFFQQYRSEAATRYLARFALQNVVTRENANQAGNTESSSWLFNIENDLLRDFRAVFPTGRATATEHVLGISQTYGTTGIHIPPYREITLDGGDTDWTGIEAFGDPSGDVSQSILNDPTAADVVDVRFAHDDSNLYIMIRTNDRRYTRRDFMYRMQFGTTGARVAIEIRNAHSDMLRINYEAGQSDHHIAWDSLENSTRIRFTEGSANAVLEVAVPLVPIVRWHYYEPMLVDVRFSAQYRGTERYELADRVDAVDNIVGLAFPVSTLLAAQDE